MRRVEALLDAMAHGEIPPKPLAQLGLHEVPPRLRDVLRDVLRYKAEISALNQPQDSSRR